MREQGIIVSEVLKYSEDASANAQTPVFVASDGDVRGVIAIADTIRDGSPEAVHELRKMGIEVSMVTGDHKRTADAIARMAGIDQVFSEVLPERKLEVVRQLKQDGKVTAMVGDGLNDAPALAEADVGIAIGTGTDIAIEASDITLMKGDLRGVVEAIRLSKLTLRIIRQNLFWAFFYNVIGIPVAAGLLYAFGGQLAVSCLPRRSGRRRPRDRTTGPRTRIRRR